MGVHIKLLGGKGLPQLHHMAQTAGVQAESGVNALALRAGFACPAVLRAQFGHGAAIAIVFRGFHERQRHVGHILLLSRQRQHCRHTQGHAGSLHLALKAPFNLSIKGVALFEVQLFRR